MSQQASEAVKTTLDIAAVGVTVGVLAQILPVIAALLTIVWTSLRIYEWFEARIRKKSDERPPRTSAD